MSVVPGRLAANTPFKLGLTLMERPPKPFQQCSCRPQISRTHDYLPTFGHRITRTTHTPPAQLLAGVLLNETEDINSPWSNCNR